MAEIDLTNIANTSISTPASGVTAIFVDTDGRVKVKNSSGTVIPVSSLNGWLDVTNYGVLPTNTPSQNVTALNNLIGTSGTAPNGSVIYFPSGVYQFNSNITVGNACYIFQGIGSNRAGSPATAYTELQLITGTTGLLTLTASYWYTQFRDLTFTAATNQVSGAMIAVGNNVGVNFLNCSFQSNGGYLYNCIDYTGANSANTTIISNCDIQGFTNYGINVNSAGASLQIVATTIQGQYVGGSFASAGINVVQAGALQMSNVDIIGSVNNLLLAPTVGLVVASVYAINTYFDYSNGSCLKITGAGATVRCKFVACSFTTNNVATGTSAIEISTTVAAGAQGIEFDRCSVLNTFGTTGTTNGFNITGGADIYISGCLISAWTNGINVTPLIPAGTTKISIVNNNIGTSGGYGVNTVGILLNAGAVAYGLIKIDENIFNNTTNITDNSTLGTGTSATGLKQILDNQGLLSPRSSNYTATTIPLTTVTNVDSLGGILIPAGFRPATIRITVHATNAATTQTLTATLRYGTNNSNADTAVLTQAFTAGTAVVGSGKFIFDVHILTSTTLGAFLRFYNGNNAATGIVGALYTYTGLATSATISTSANNWLGVYFSSATASAITIRAVTYEIVQQ